MFLRRSIGVMFEDRKVEENPCVMVRKEMGKDFTYIVERRSGTYYRVIPNSAREVFYIQMLVPNVDALIPEEGDGVILSAKAIEHCDYRS
mgnify:FL=1